MGGSGWGGQGGCEFLGKFTQKKIMGGGVGRGGSGGGGGGGQGGCEPRIEGIVQCTKRYCTILRK